MAGFRVNQVAFVNRALQQASKDIRQDIQKELHSIGEAAERDAEVLAPSTIPTIGFRWSQMRTGQRVDMVYIAPVARGTRQTSKKRPNLAPLLLGRAMRPAVFRRAPETERRFKKVLARVAAAFNRGSL